MSRHPFVPALKKFTNHRSVFLHATWLVQTLVHWPIFLTAASRRSLVRVSVPMWGTFLSEPLSIVGLVGRYPANCLMERMPIYQRWIFNKYPHAGPLFYAVLVRLSPGYPPLIGKLHTRYSPVRRSPAVCCHTPLPLDLHVLSLSLAFILSQDQTLRCWFVLCLQPKIPFLLELKYFFDGMSSLILVLLVVYVNLSKNFSRFYWELRLQR